MCIQVAFKAQEFTGRSVLFKCDNMSVVNACASDTAKDPSLLFYLHVLDVLQLHFNFRLKVEWIATKENVIPDLLSRGKTQEFIRQKFGANLREVSVPPLSLPTNWKRFIEQSLVQHDRHLSKSMALLSGTSGDGIPHLGSPASWSTDC